MLDIPYTYDIASHALEDWAAGHQQISTILTKLHSLLAPLGQYRAQHINISKGRRDKKRKRKESKESIKPTSPLPAPPAPELRSYVDVGLSTITRSLQESAEKGQTKNLSDDQVAEDCPACPYSTIFVARSGQPNVLNTHLPQMVAVASKAHPRQLPIRLVGLSKACEERLSLSLGIPRVSCIAIHHNAPNSKPLVDFTQEHVPIVDIQWLEEAGKAEHRETKINSIQTSIGIKKQTIRT